MKIRDFGLEIFFGRYEFSAPYLLAQSDCESLSIRELLALEPGSQEGFLDTWLGYSENDGAPALREAVSGLYAQCGPENVLLHVGAQEAIFGALNVLVEPGEHVICQFPTYQSLYEVARAAGCGLSLWPLHQGGEGWYCDLDELERLITPRTRLLVLNTPNNPTGYALSADERQRICGLARRHGLRILADEVYRGLEAPDAVPPAFCDSYERAFSVGVLSKAYGLPGLRVGWIASQERDAIGALSRYKNYLSICCPTPSEALARIALKHGPAILARNREIIARNRRIAADFFARYDHVFRHNPPQAGPIAFHGLRPDFVARFGSALAFCEHLAQSAGVLLLPGNVYDMDEPYVRMGYGRANFADNLAVLDNWLQRNG